MNRRIVVAQAGAEIRMTLRRGESLLATLGIPLGVLVFFDAVDVIDTGFEDPLDFLVPGVLAISVVATAMVSLGIATGFERRYGVLKRLGTTPLTRPALIAAKMAAVGVVEVIQVGAVVTVGIALGWDPDAGLWAAAGLLALGTVAFAGLGLLMAGSLPAELTLASTNALYVLFLLVGGVAVPLDDLPGALEAAARLTPVAQLTETVRAVLVPGQGVEPWMIVGLAVWAVAAPVAASLAFRWEE